MRLTFSGTDTIKRGASPSASISSISRLKEPTTNVSYVTQKSEVLAKNEKIEEKKDENIEKVEKIEKLENVDKVGKVQKVQKVDDLPLSTLNSTRHGDLKPSQSEPPVVSRTSSLLNDYSVKDSIAQKSSLFSSDIYALSSKYKDSTFLATTRSSPIAYTTASSAAASASNLEDVLANYNKPSFSSYSSTSRSEALPAYSSYSSTTTPASAHLSSLLKSDTTTTKSDNNDSSFSYQFSSSHLKSPATTSASSTLTDTSSSRFNDEATSSIAYTSILNKISTSLSPFRTMITSTNSNTSTLPHLGRANNLLYQSESSPVTKSSASNPSTYPSPASTTNNVYGTLPKTTSSSPYKSFYTSDNGESAPAASTKFTPSSFNFNSDFSNSPPTTSNGASGNGQYRVQYSSANPFLSAFEPPSTTNSTVDVSSNASIMRGNVGNIINRFDRLDSEEDLK